MQSWGIMTFILSICLFLQIAVAQDDSSSDRIVKEGAKVEIYKTSEDSKGEEVKLNLFIFEPEDHQPTDRRSAIVFFFGGGWNGGSPSQFVPHCKYLAKRGMVAITADYRVKSRQGTPAIACVSDGKSAVRWIRKNSDRLGVDPDRIASGGGSAGGHVAACTGVIKTLDEDSEDKSISSIPNAMVLFNPALAIAPFGDFKIPANRMAAMEKRIGADPKTVSPYHHVASDLPPTIVFHGKKDKTVPYLTAEAFAKAMTQAGNRCELKSYPDEGHGFFNFNRKNGKFNETVAQMDQFLVSLGFLKSQEKSESAR
ncbi:MAG: alpha/beta hydrolase [Planctomycetota bacterium]